MLARHIIRIYPEYYEFFGLKEFNYSKFKFINRNPLLGLVAGVDGLQPGFTKDAGYGMVASAKQDSRRLIAVVNGLGTAYPLELSVAARAIHHLLGERGVTVARSLVGTLVTSLDMKGVSVTLTAADRDLLPLWDAPVRTPALSW